jgi:flagellar protein FlgJ
MTPFWEKWLRFRLSFRFRSTGARTFERIKECLVGRPMKPPMFTGKTFLEAFRPAFEKTANRLGVSWLLIATQAGLESGNGNSQLATQEYNFFGVTAGSWLVKGKPVKNYPTKEQRKDGTWVVENRWFRKYATLEEGLDDYANILLKLYPKALERGRAGDAQGFFQELKNGGYASDQKYVEKLAQRYAEIKPQEGLA